VPTGQLLGYLISERGIEGNPKKIQAIINMQPPKTLRHVQQLTGRLAALSHFISKLGEKALPFYRLLRKTDNFTWTEEAQAAFDDLKRRLSTSPVLVTPERKMMRTSLLHHHYLLLLLMMKMLLQRNPTRLGLDQLQEHVQSYWNNR
jgi:hypothetical protein